VLRAVAIAAGALAVWLPIVLIGAAPASPGAYRDAPPPGFSSGFGEPSCHACHFSREPNQAPGGLALRGVPERYAPGATYPITVILTRPGMSAAGFQLTARFTDGARQAGSLAPAPSDSSRVAITISYDIAYAHQLRAGSAPAGRDSASWTLLWTAPAAAGAVSFHAAANAADGDDTVDGDFVYTTSATTSGATRGRAFDIPLPGLYGLPPGAAATLIQSATVRRSLLENLTSTRRPTARSVRDPTRALCPCADRSIQIRVESLNATVTGPCGPAMRNVLAASSTESMVPITA
jgi:hypothetical protein